MHSFESVNDSNFEFERMHIVLAWDKFLAQKPSEFLISIASHQQNNKFLPSIAVFKLAIKDEVSPHGNYI